MEPFPSTFHTRRIATNGRDHALCRNQCRGGIVPDSRHWGGRTMDTTTKQRKTSAEQRLKELGIELPEPPEPFGSYVEAVQTGNLLFLSGMLPTEGREAKVIGRVGAELDVEGGRKAAKIAARNALAVARHHLGSLDRVTRAIRLAASAPTSRHL